MRNRIRGLFTSLAVTLVPLLFPARAMAEDAISPGDTAWMLTSSALILLMTLPGLALFYGGLVRTKNILSVLMQCMITAAVIGVLWVIVGYSLAFDEGNAFVGGLGMLGLSGIGPDSVSGTIPTYVFVMFQGMFAIITPALMLGAFAERMRFGPYMVFIAVWVLVVYCPLAHMVWGGGIISQWGAIDFAGGLVVHMSRASYSDITSMVSSFDEKLDAPWVMGAWNVESTHDLFALSREISRQALMIGYNDAFLFFAATALAMLPLALLVRPAKRK